MTKLQPTPEELLRIEYLDLRDQLEQARRLRRRFERQMMWSAARLADREAARLQERVTAIEARLDAA